MALFYISPRFNLIISLFDQQFHIYFEGDTFKTHFFIHRPFLVYTTFMTCSSTLLKLLIYLVHIASITFNIIICI